MSARDDRPVPSIRPVSADDPDALHFAQALHDEMVIRYEDPDPCGGPGPLDPRARWIVLCDDSGGAIGLGAVQPLVHTVANAAGDEGEIKRVFIAEHARGHGASHLLMAALETAALDAGWVRLRLETGLRQPEALALYARNGWEPIPAYGQYKDSPDSRCFAKDLRGTQS